MNEAKKLLKEIADKEKTTVQDDVFVEGKKYNYSFTMTNDKLDKIR